MKNSCLLTLGLLTLLLAATPTHAQQWTGALKAGGTITNFSGESTSSETDFEPRTGLVGGVAFGYDFGGGLAVLSEVLYIRKGAFADVTLDDIPLRIRSDLTYVQVPVLVQYLFQTGGTIQPKLFAGPLVAFNLDSKIQFRAPGSDLRQTEDDDSIEKRDLGALVGAGFEFEMSDQRFTFEARAAFGIADITKPNPDGENPILKNTGIEFLIGVVF